MPGCPPSLSCGLHWPAAVHASPAEQDTLDRAPLTEVCGDTGKWTCQLVPSHCSDTMQLKSQGPGGKVGGWVPVWNSPTAVQALADAHDTAPRSPAVVPLGAGTGWTVHVVP